MWCMKLLIVLPICTKGSEKISIFSVLFEKLLLVWLQIHYHEHKNVIARDEIMICKLRIIVLRNGATIIELAWKWNNLFNSANFQAAGLNFCYWTTDFQQNYHLIELFCFLFYFIMICIDFIIWNRRKFEIHHHCECVYFSIPSILISKSIHKIRAARSKNPVADNIKKPWMQQPRALLINLSNWLLILSRSCVLLN